MANRIPLLELGEKSVGTSIFFMTDSSMMNYKECHLKICLAFCGIGDHHHPNS
jgi:hypothetical protein